MNCEYVKSKHKGFLIEGDCLQRKSDGLVYKYNQTFYENDFSIYHFIGNNLAFLVHFNCLTKFFETDDRGIKIFKEVVK